MKKRIFITGAAGFIGSHLAKQLQKRGDSVLGLDNFNDYYDPQLKRDRAKLLETEINEGDIADFQKLEKIVRQFNPTHIVHLAAQAGVRTSVTHPHLYMQTNLNGFFHILEVCRQRPNVPLIYASSSSVYGLNEKAPFSTDDMTDRPASLYGATKKANELLAHSYHHLYGIPVTGLRFFTVYGPWGRPDMAYYKFAKAILNNEPIDIYNQGKMQRDFTYIDDIVEGTTAAIDYAGECEIFNLGNNEPVALMDFISLIEKGLGKEAIKNFTSMQQGDVTMTYADISRSQQLLGYQPKTSIQQGLTHFLKWYKDYCLSKYPAKK